mmetsp:Transcript_55401/g.125902  ORF Transcript_55401/g.125902 Transcript_55401/m.125902 type:complete len:215 (+) Transcript_55401:229-873(+)
MQSLFENLDRLWEITVLPQPKAPGTAQVPPSTEGKSASTTRSPVVRAVLPGSLSAVGRGIRTGQKWDMLSAVVWPVCSLRTSRTVSFTVNMSDPSVPLPYTFTTVPATLGGHMMQWLRMISFSKTVPNTSPGAIDWPSRKLHGLKAHCFTGSRDWTETPRGTYTSCDSSAMVSSGRWIPSKMVFMMPGPSCTLSGCRVRWTGSPTVRPDVSSYT